MPPRKRTAKTLDSSSPENEIKETKAVTTVESLFGAPEVVEVKQTSKGYSRVEVPDTILAVVQGILDHNRSTAVSGEKRKMLTYAISSPENIEAMAPVLYSAADILGCTVIVSPVYKDEDEFHKVKDVTKATHIRVSVGERRGKRSGATASDSAESGTEDGE